jgi:hypothetical protein
MPTIPQKLYDLIEFGFKTTDWPGYREWVARTQSFLQTVFPNEAAQFGSIRDALTNLNNWPLARAAQIGLLEGLAREDGGRAGLVGGARRLAGGIRRRSSSTNQESIYRPWS